MAVTRTNPRDFGWASTARSTTRPTAAGPGMVMRPEPLAAAIEAVEAARGPCPPDPAVAPGPPVRPGDGRRRWRSARACCWCAAATRASTSGWRRCSPTRSSASATTCCRAARWPPRWSSRRCARLVPGVIGKSESTVDESLLRRPAGVPALHPPARVPRPGRPRGAAVGRPRGDRGLAPARVPAPHRDAARTCWPHPPDRASERRLLGGAADARPGAARPAGRDVSGLGAGRAGRARDRPPRAGGASRPTPVRPASGPTSSRS